jgi:hypothetical protein
MAKIRDSRTGAARPFELGAATVDGPLTAS